MKDADRQRFIVPAMEPKYLDPAVQSSLKTRAQAAVQQLRDCRLCPRDCGGDRFAEARGVCRTGRHARVASAFPHFGEEDCLRGSRGSGTIFFAGCSLGCVFCQNWDISQRGGAGVELNADQLAALMLDLQKQGCHNINFVTPTHVVPQIIEALARAIPRGLNRPIVYNSSGYDLVSTIEQLNGLVDIYMPDLKFWSSATAERLARAPDYPQRARAAISEMHRQVGDLCFTLDGVAQRGLLLRHLVMPGKVDESHGIFAWLAKEISPDTFVNIMGQYRPENKVGDCGASLGEPCAFAEINRRPTRDEMAAAYEAARSAGLWRFDERGPSAF